MPGKARPIKKRERLIENLLGEGEDGERKSGWLNLFWAIPSRSSVESGGAEKLIGLVNLNGVGPSAPFCFSFGILRTITIQRRRHAVPILRAFPFVCFRSLFPWN